MPKIFSSAGTPVVATPGNGGRVRLHVDDGGVRVSIKPEDVVTLLHDVVPGLTVTYEKPIPRPTKAGQFVRHERSGSIGMTTNFPNSGGDVEVIYQGRAYAYLQKISNLVAIDELVEPTKEPC